MGSEVEVSGFVHALRIQSKIIFLVLRDVSGMVQTVIEASVPEVFEVAKNLSLESVVTIKGIAKAFEKAIGGVEISVQGIEVLSKAAPELPIPVVVKGNDEESEAPVRFDYRWIDIRKPEKTNIFKTWTALERGFRKAWLENDFIQIYTPSFMQTASETGAEVFEVKYFDRKAYLAQSPQFYKQMAMAAGLERVFIAGPVFRAEESFTTRHMTEFTGWDFEMAYIDSHEDVMNMMEKLIVSGFKELGIDVHTPFPRVTMLEAKKIVGGDVNDHDLNPDEEKKISEYVKEKYNHDFVFVTEYHKEKSAFYHRRLTDGADRSRRADLIYKGIEIVTLAQREHRVDILEKQALEKGMNLEELKDYMNFFRYGCPPHGGAGIGPGRIIMKLLDLPNVREATYLPRDVKRLNP